jgi:hypothetical protein
MKNGMVMPMAAKMMWKPSENAIVARAAIRSSMIDLNMMPAPASRKSVREVTGGYYARFGAQFKNYSATRPAISREQVLPVCGIWI